MGCEFPRSRGGAADLHWGLAPHVRGGCAAHALLPGLANHGGDGFAKFTAREARGKLADL